MGTVCSIESEKAVIDISASGHPVQPTAFICRNIAKSESQLQDSAKATSERKRRSRRTLGNQQENHDTGTTSEYHSRTRFSIQPMHEERNHESRTPVVKILQKEPDDVIKSEMITGQGMEEQVLPMSCASPSDETELVLDDSNAKSRLSTSRDGDPPPPHKCSSTDVNMSSSWTDIEAKYRDVSSKCAKYQDMARSPEPDLDATSKELSEEKSTCLTQCDQKLTGINDFKFKNAEVKDKAGLTDNSLTPVETDVTSLARGMMLTAITSACHEMTSSDSAVSFEYLEDITKNYQRTSPLNATRTSPDHVQLGNETNNMTLSLSLDGTKEAEMGLKAEIRKDQTVCTNSIVVSDKTETEYVPKAYNDSKQDISSNVKLAVLSDSQNNTLTNSKFQKHEETTLHSSAIQESASKNRLINAPGKESVDHKETPSKAQNNPSHTDDCNIITGSNKSVRDETNQNEQSVIHTKSPEKREVGKPLSKHNILDKGDSTKKSRSRTRSTRVGPADIDVQENNSNDSKPMSQKVTSPDKEGVSGPTSRLTQAFSSEDQCVIESETEGFPLKKTTKNTNLLVRDKVQDKKPVINKHISKSNKMPKPKQEDRSRKRGFQQANTDRDHRDRISKQATIQASMSPLSKSIAYFPLADTKPMPDKRNSQMKDHFQTKQRNPHPQGGRSVSAAEFKLIDHKTSRFSNAAVSAYPNETK